MSEDKEETQPSTLSEAEAEEAVAKAEYEAAKEEATEPKPATDGTLRTTTISDEVASSELVVKADVAYEAAKEKVQAARATSEAAWKVEYEAIKAEAGEIRQAGQFSDRYKQDRIFRREMGEPEFFLMDIGPVKPILTGDEIEEIARKVQVPKDQTPKYDPEHILSPEFGGTSNYESSISDMMEKAKQKLVRLMNDPEATQQEIELAKLDLTKLNYLYDNFHMGMNVFRTAKGGRDTLRE